MPQLTPSLSETVRFIQTYAPKIKNKLAFRGWNFEQEDQSIWLAMLASSGHVFHSIENDEIYGVAMVLPLPKENEFHLSQILCRRRKDILTLWEAFKAKFPNGIIVQSEKRGKFRVHKRPLRIIELLKTLH